MCNILVGSSIRLIVPATYAALRLTMYSNPSLETRVTYSDSFESAIANVLINVNRSLQRRSGSALHKGLLLHKKARGTLVKLPRDNT